jgi:phytoene synthase
VASALSAPCLFLGAARGIAAFGRGYPSGGPVKPDHDKLVAVAGYCESLVRRQDYDRYIAALFAPEAVRPDLFALYAFNYEIAKIAETVKNPVAGQIRLQWWRERIDEIYAGAPGRTELLTALGSAVARHRLDRSLIDDLIDAREFDLDRAPFADLPQLEAYADATSGNLMRLAARVLGAGETLDENAGEAGIAYSVTGLMRALPFHAGRAHIAMPADEMARAGVAPDELLRGRMLPQIGALIAGVSEIARAHYRRVRRTERRHLPAILPSAVVPAFIRVLNRRGFDAYRDSTEIPGYRRQWIMLRAVIVGRLPNR